MLRSYFRRIRMQPKPVRDRHALIIASVFTGVVATAWVFTQLQTDTATERKISTDSQPPFSGLVNQIKDQWAGVKDSLPEEVNGEVGGLSEEVIGNTEKPDNLKLEKDNLDQVREDAAVSGEWNQSNNAKDEDQIQYQEVQIIAVPKEVATKTATSTN